MSHMRKLATVFLAALFFSIHLALVSYVNSSMLGRFVSANIVSVLFSTGSALSILLTLSAPLIMRKIGALRLSLGLFALSALLLSILGTTTLEPLILGAFVLYFALNASIFYCIDIFIEHYSTENATGKIRGLSLTINNLGWISMPLVAGTLTTLYGFSAVYLLAAVAVAVVGIVIALSQRNFVERPQQIQPNFIAAFKHIRQTPALRRIISINFLLQLFYSWMVLYVPLYLTHTLGLPWSTIGVIISIMLLPFVLFQYPAGRIADRWLGEKEMMITALVIMAATTILLAVKVNPTVAVLAAILFGTRVGASVLEVLSDSYFFKQVTDADGGVISFYRVMQPFAYIIGPIVGALLLLVVSYTTLFFILGIVLFVGALYTLRLVDTR